MHQVSQDRYSGDGESAMTQLELGEKLFKQFVSYLPRFIVRHVILEAEERSKQYLVWAAEEGMKGIASNPAIAPVLTPTGCRLTNQ